MRERSHEQLEGGSLRGRVLTSHLDWARQRLGEAGYNVMLRELAPELRAVVGEQFDPLSWQPFAICVAIDKAIAARVEASPSRTYRHLGRHSASLNLGQDGAPHMADPHEFMRRDALLQGNWVDFGRADYQPLGPKAGRLDLLEWTCFSEPFCVSAEGFFERALGIYGAMHPRVSQSRCLCRGDDICRFELEWD